MWGIWLGHHSLNYKIREYLKQLQIAVARDGIEPPTHGFPVRFKPLLLNFIG